MSKLQTQPLACDSKINPAFPTEPLQGARLRRERQTLQAMIVCYCGDHHVSSRRELCPDCQSLLSYATVRLARCRFGESKPTCANCPVHCYQAQWREQVKAVMRYAGPRMLWKHPILALRHLLDGRRTLCPLISPMG